MRHMPALAVPKEEVIDTNGAGDIFHGAYVYSYLRAPEKPWEEHFRFARAASAHSVRFLGIERRCRRSPTSRRAARLARGGVTDPRSCATRPRGRGLIVANAHRGAAR